MDKLFYEIFEAAERQGPGDDESTARAFNKLKHISKNPDILDIGCGTGSQTNALARLTKGKIIAIDNHFPFIRTLIKNRRNNGLKGGIQPVVADMSCLPFRRSSFDLIWSEGAAFVMGFNNALECWHIYLKSKGYLVLSELTWFDIKVPDEIKQYLTAEYPDIKLFSDHLPFMESAGYEIIDHFPLPLDSWVTGFYNSIEESIASLRSKYKSSGVGNTFEMLETEIHMFRKYSNYYGYTFYVLRSKN